jgi:hypothetical protein
VVGRVALALEEDFLPAIATLLLLGSFPVKKGILPTRSPVPHGQE